MCCDALHNIVNAKLCQTMSRATSYFKYKCPNSPALLQKIVNQKSVKEQAALCRCVAKHRTPLYAEQSYNRCATHKCAHQSHFKDGLLISAAL